MKIHGKCSKCGTPVLKLKGPGISSFRADNIRFVYADNPDSQWCIFRCEKCRGVIDETFMPDSKQSQTEVSTLHIPIKKKWFDMIKTGEKKAEYREIKDYWVRRLVSFDDNIETGALDEFIGDLHHPGRRHNGVDELMDFFGASFRDFDFVEFRNGYGRDAPSLKVKLKKIMVSTGRESWGAEPFKFYFVLKLGKVAS